MIAHTTTTLRLAKHFLIFCGRKLGFGKDEQEFLEDLIVCHEVLLVDLSGGTRC